jgi:hypothetical protein
MSSNGESDDTIHNEVARRFSIVSKLVHYTSKFTPTEDRRPSTLQTSTRYQTVPKNGRRQSALDTFDRFVLVRWNKI